MKRFAVLACLAVASMVATGQLFQPSTMAQDGVKKAETKTSTYRKRLPNYYGQVGLSAKQKDEVYSVQKSYHDQIEALRQQIADLESKRDAEVRDVLSEDQQKKVDELVSAAKAKAEARRKAKNKSE